MPALTNGSMPNVLELGALILVLIIAAGLLRFFLRLAWRLVSLALTATVLIGAALYLMGYIHIR